MHAMRASTLVMVGFAVVFGLLAVFIANTWLNSQAARHQHVTGPAAATPTQTIVVAKEPLRYGTELNASMLKEVAWAGDAVPAGAFHRICDVHKRDGRA